MSVNAFVVRAVAAITMFMAVTSVNAWTVNLDFDDQEPEDRCRSLDSGRSYVSSDQAASPPNACTFWIKKGQTGWGTWGGTIDFPRPITDGGEVWLRLRVYMPEEFDYTSPGEGKRLKLIRFRTYDSGGEYVGYNNIYLNPPGSKRPYGFIYGGESNWQMFGNPTDAPEAGKWDTYEFYLRFDEKKNVGESGAAIRWWKNGELLFESFERKTLVDDGGYAKYLYLGTYWNGGAPKTQHMYVDDIVMTNEKPSSVDAHGNALIGLGKPD